MYSFQTIKILTLLFNFLLKNFKLNLLLDYSNLCSQNAIYISVLNLSSPQASILLFTICH